jgi:hypothetical protein
MKTLNTLAAGLGALGALGAFVALAPWLATPHVQTVGTSSLLAAVPAMAAGRSSQALPVARVPQPGPQAVNDTLYALESAVAAARARGADENALYRLRASGLPAQTIAMLTERERAEQAWTLRLVQWRAESARLHNDAAALQALQDRLFTKEEQGRLGAYTESAAPQLRFNQDDQG